MFVGICAVHPGRRPSHRHGGAGALGTIVGNYVVKLFVSVYGVTGGIAVGLLAAVWPFIVMGGTNGCPWLP